MTRPNILYPYFKAFTREYADSGKKFIQKLIEIGYANVHHYTGMVIDNKGFYLYGDPLTKTIEIVYNYDSEKVENLVELGSDISRIERKPYQEYYFINSQGECITDVDGNDYYDRARYNFGNYFPTQEKAKEAKNKIHDLLINLI